MFPTPATKPGRFKNIETTRSTFRASKTKDARRSSCPYAKNAWRHPLSRSSGAQRSSWRMIWRVRRLRELGCRPAETRMWRISDCSTPPSAKLIFDIADFDETEIAPWEWDVKRLGASLEICGRERGFDSKVRRAIVKTAAEAYREAMREFARMGTLDVWYAHMDADELYERMAHKASKSERKEAEELLDKARSKNSARAIKKLTEVVDGELRIVNEPPLIVPLRGNRTAVQRNGRARPRHARTRAHHGTTSFPLSQKPPRRQAQAHRAVPRCRHRPQGRRRG